MTIQVTIGKWYAVSGAAGSTVTTPDGSITLCTVPDGGQGYFNAPTTSVETSDDTVKVTQATFNLALAALGLLGGGVKINLMKYAHCKTQADIKAVNPLAQTDLTSDGAWVYLLPLYEPPGTYVNNNFPLVWKSKVVKRWLVDLPAAKKIGYMFAESLVLEVVRCKTPSATNAYAVCAGSLKLKEYKGDLSNVVNLDHGFEACPLELLEVVALNKLERAQLAFGNCLLSKALTLYVLGLLPTYTSGEHPITMGVHVDYQTDADVLAAIDTATARGWTVAVQWNGTPTRGMRTFGFKRVWVRKTQDAEYGRYADANGMRWSVEWCDMLSAPDGSTPEDHGYELYRSVDAAVAYWELEPYVDPDTVQLLTD